MSVASMSFKVRLAHYTALHLLATGTWNPVNVVTYELLYEATE